MYKVIIDPNAQLDLNRILDYIFRFSFSSITVNKIYDEIMSKIYGLQVFPKLYPVFKWDFRVMTVRKNYRIFYKINEAKKEVIIYYIFSSRENYDDLIY